MVLNILSYFIPNTINKYLEVNKIIIKKILKL